MSSYPKTGSTWGRWTIIGRARPAKRYGETYARARVVVRCVCGREQPVFVCDLRSGRTAGCRSRRCQIDAGVVALPGASGGAEA